LTEAKSHAKKVTTGYFTKGIIARKKGKGDGIKNGKINQKANESQ